MTETDDLIRWQVREQTATLRAEVDAWKERAQKAEATAKMWQDEAGRAGIAKDLAYDDRDALLALLAEARALIASPYDGDQDYLLSLDARIGRALLERS